MPKKQRALKPLTSPAPLTHEQEDEINYLYNFLWSVIRELNIHYEPNRKFGYLRISGIKTPYTKEDIFDEIIKPLGEDNIELPTSQKAKHIVAVYAKINSLPLEEQKFFNKSKNEKTMNTLLYTSFLVIPAVILIVLAFRSLAQRKTFNPFISHSELFKEQVYRLYTENRSLLDQAVSCSSLRS